MRSRIARLRVKASGRGWFVLEGGGILVFGAEVGPSTWAVYAISPGGKRAHKEYRGSKSAVIRKIIDETYVGEI